ncbi:50S ribosomal protein L24 [Candidatus Peregrinibacteria bacterium]|nr:50S ribosomal protein L24 [Candidatus Peregrinibacteria bacterium]
MKIKTGDTVVVIAGKNRNKTGRVMKIDLKNLRVVVEGVNKVTRHHKKTKQGAGRKVEFEAPIHVSNVMVLDPKTKKPTRVGYKMDGKKKVRYAKKSGEVLSDAKNAEPAKSTKKAK